MVYCSSCGTANRDGSRFCNACGAKLPSLTSVHCSKCGTPNPPSNVFCDKCGTRLVPVLADEVATSEPEPPVVPIKKGLSLPTKPAAAGPSTPIEPLPATPQSESGPDWLSQLRTTSAASSDEENESDGSSDSSDSHQPSDWLARLSSSTSAPAAGPEKSATPVDDAPDELRDATREEQPEWLQRIAGYSSAEGKPPASPSTADTLIVPQAQSPTPRPTNDIPDWLSNLGVVTPSQVDQSEPEPTVSTDVPDWLSNLGVVASTPTQPSAPNAQPLQSRGTNAPPAPQPAPEQSETAAEEPDWLKNLSTSVPPPVAEPTASEDMPDWLRGMSAPAVAQPQPAKPEADVPDWLNNLGASTSIPATQSAAPVEEEKPSTLGQEPADEAAVPDWLTELSTGKVPSTQAAPPEAESPDLPDWLSGGAPAQAQVAPAEPAPAIPDWLNELAPEGSTTIPPTAAPAKAAQPTPAGELPEWARKLGKTTMPTVPAPAEPGQAEEVSAEMPGWLKSMRAEKDKVPATGAGLTQAEIPAWLEALRPTEDKTAEAAEPQEAEKEGVFAGILQVLPPAPIMGEVQGTPAKLFVETPAEDLARASLFQELLTRAASAPTPIVALPGRGARLRKKLLQWVIATALILVVVVALQFDVKVGPAIGSFPDRSIKSIEPAYQQMAPLSSKSTVLVVFDYDPIQAGELDRIAEVFLRQLRKQNVNVIVASLNPLGAALADRVWQKLDPEFKTSASSLTDKDGYVPGQAIGAQSLLDKYGQRIDLVIDLAGSSDSVRWWVEQMAVTGLHKPLIVGVSAAAQTLTLPYAGSGQISGVVSGVIGAFSYAQRANLLPAVAQQQQVTQNQAYLVAQILAQWLLAVLIIAGLISGLVFRTGRRSS